MFKPIHSTTLGQNVMEFVIIKVCIIWNVLA